MLVNASVQYGQLTNLTVYNTISIIKPYKSNSASDVCKAGGLCIPFWIRHCLLYVWLQYSNVTLNYERCRTYRHIARTYHICHYSSPLMLLLSHSTRTRIARRASNRAAHNVWNNLQIDMVQEQSILKIYTTSQEITLMSLMVMMNGII